MSNKEYNLHIEKCPVDYSLCTGCVSCEMICSLVHEGNVGPQNKRIFLKKGKDLSMVHDVLTCMQCADHPCYDACPKKDTAMQIDEGLGIVYIVDEYCIGCGLCQRACKFTPSRINLVKSKDRTQRKARKCDLCRTRPEGPACVQNCPCACLAVSDSIPWESEK